MRVDPYELLDLPSRLDDKVLGEATELTDKVRAERDRITAEYRAMVTKRLVRLGRMCTMEEIGEIESFLASDRAAMITGQSLAVDGGTLSGWGEDLRPVVRKRMADAKAGNHG